MPRLLASSALAAFVAASPPVFADELRLERDPDQTRLVRTDEAGTSTTVAAWPDTPDSTWVLDLTPWPPDGTLRVVRHEPPPASPCTRDLPPIDAHLWDEAAATFVRAPAPPAPLEGTLARTDRLEPGDPALAPFRDPRLAGTVRAASGVPGHAFAAVDALARTSAARWSPARRGPDASLLIRTAAGLRADHLILALPDDVSDVAVAIQTTSSTALARLPGPGAWRVALPESTPCAWVTFHARPGAPAPVVTHARLDADLARALDSPDPLDAPTLAVLEAWLDAHAAPLAADVVTRLAARWPIDLDAFASLTSTAAGPARDALLEALLDAPLSATGWPSLDPAAQERLVARARLRPLTPFDDDAAIRIAEDPATTAALRALAFDRALAAQDASALWVLAQVDLDPDRDGPRIFGWLIDLPDASLAELAALTLLDRDDDGAATAQRVALEAMLARGTPLVNPAWPDLLLAAFDSPVGTVARISLHLGPHLDPPSDAVNARTDAMRTDDPHPRIRAAAARAALSRLPTGDPTRAALWDAALTDRAPDARVELAQRCDDDVPTTTLTARLQDETWPDVLAPLVRCALDRGDPALDDLARDALARLRRDDLLLLRRTARLDGAERAALARAIDAALEATARPAPTPSEADAADEDILPPPSAP